MLGINHLFSQAIVVDHLSTDISKIPSEWIVASKLNLHIAYGHTSHGSQITDGACFISFSSRKILIL